MKTKHLNNTQKPKNPIIIPAELVWWEFLYLYCMKAIITESQLNERAYREWKKNNVTYRGIKNTFGPNNEYGANVLGEGLYSVPRSNIAMARQYGELRLVVNAKPKKPKIFRTLNEWEIWFQGNLLKQFDYNIREFEKNTTIRAEMLKLGYDGVIITGREMVNYTPENVLYFSNETQLENYFYDAIQNDDL